MSDANRAGAAAPVAYIPRTHAFYRAQGFERDYAYAQHRDIPFTPLAAPVAASRLALVTTASTYARAPLEPRRVDAFPWRAPPERLHTDDLSWDKEATHTEDRESFCPLGTLEALTRDGVLGSLAERVHCVPTEYSQRATRERDAPLIRERILADGADAALLAPL